MKKHLCLIASLMLMASCGTNSEDPKTDPVDTTPTVSDTATEAEPTTIDYSQFDWATYMNPVDVSSYTGEVADPSVVRDPETGKFYCFSTNRILLESDDGCNWTQKATGERVLKDYTGWGAQVQPGKSLGFWAPDVQQINGKWYYFYSLSGWGAPAGVGYGISDDIAGPYTDCGELFNINNIAIANCIDPNVIVDENGDIWCTAGSFQGEWLVQLEIDDEGLLSCYNGVDYQKEHKILIAGKESGGWDGSQYEGGYIIKKGEYYYYFGSAGTCCEGQNSTYRVMVGKSKSVQGPYIDHNGMPLTMSGNGTTYGELVVWGGTNNPDVAGPGHNSIVVDDAGEYWIYYHSYSSMDNFQTRHLFMDKLEWNDLGYPYVVKAKPSFQEEKDGPKLK